jgi:hypothetical protein
MIINLYANYSDNNVMDKNISLLKTLTGTLRDDCSIINPIINIENLSPAELTKANYAYIPDFGRYYYINNITLKKHLYELQMHVDVLMSFKDGIRLNNAVISRQQKSYNLYLRDGVFKCEAGDIIQIKQFSGGFDDFNFIFCVAG